MRHVSQAQQHSALFHPPPSQRTKAGNRQARRALQSPARKRVWLTDHGPRFFDRDGLLRIHHRPTGPGGIDHRGWRWRGARARARARRRREGLEKKKGERASNHHQDSLGKRRTETQAKVEGTSGEMQSRVLATIPALVLAALNSGWALFLGGIFFYYSSIFF